MLYIVATPIGNMGEISERAKEVLKNVSLIAAEDTRHSGILLKNLGIDKPLCAYQKFNEEFSSDGLIRRLIDGEDIALISDAGMPLICDPGKILLDKCVLNNIPFTVISGACALINALILSGLNVGEFTFLGFLPDKQKLRKEKIAPYLKVPSSLIFYSPVQSVVKDLEFLRDNLGSRNAAVVREISKKFEEVVRFNLDFIPEIKNKGEFVLVIEGFKEQLSTKSSLELVNEYMGQGLAKMDAIKKAALDKGISKSTVYNEIEKNK